jgi:fructosamine-3-kinase
MTSGSENLASQRIGPLLNVPVTEVRAVGAQHGYEHLTARLADGREVFAKAALGAGGGQAAELLPPGHPTEQAALEFGGGLARTHAAGAFCFPAGADQPAFGAPWPGFIASLPLDNSPGREWAPWYAEQRIVPYLRRASDYGALSGADVRLVEAVVARIGELAGPPEPPSRIHGDLWSGNLLWSGGRGWLIDPAAHGGHRETDLAMLALFGAPHLDAILRAYAQTSPLADGWRDRVPLHQLHPLLVHACLFGASYAPQVRAAARTSLAA